MSNAPTEHRPTSFWPALPNSFLYRGFRYLDEPTPPAWAASSLLLLIQIIIAFPYIWTGNEENYFALAHQWIAPESVRAFDAVFDHSHGKFFGLALFGLATQLLGDENGRLAIGLLAFALVAFGFARMTRALNLSLIDMVVVFAAFLFCGQSFFGGEWFIGGIETKTFAYGCGLAALADALQKRPTRAAFLCAAATYFHFLVAAFWIGSTALFLLSEHGRRKLAGVFLAIVALLIAPVMVAIGGDSVSSSSIVPPSGMPSADYIYSILRASHHVAPFASPGWLRPVTAATMASILIATILSFWSLNSQLLVRQFALLIAALALCIPVALALSWLDRATGSLGKFYLFRPVAPILLLSLFAFVAIWRQKTVGQFNLRAMPNLTIIAMLAVAAVNGSLRASNTGISEPARALAQALRVHTKPDDPILLDPEIDTETSLQRIADRPMIVNWKYVPTNPAEIYRWWSLLQYRKFILSGHCPEKDSTIKFIVITKAGQSLVEKCGKIVWQNMDYALISLFGNQSVAAKEVVQ